MRAILLLSGFFAIFSAAADDLLSWQKLMPIEFSGYPADAGTLTNFPALIILSNTAAGAGFDYADFLSPPWDDLRFAADDKTTPLDFEVESWNPGGLSYVWVRIPELTNNTLIHALWGKGGVIAPPCATNGSVWDDKYRAVWHMNDGADNAHISDSSSNRHSGVKKAAASPVETDAVVGKGQKFSSNYINVTGLSDPGKTHTISMLINGTSAAASLYAFDVQSGRLLVGWSSDSAKLGIYGTSWANFGNVPSLSVWHHIVFLFESSGSANCYVDGVKYGSTLSHTPAVIGGAVSIGCRYSFDSYYFPGMLDEIRVSSVIRSSNWIRACFMNMASNSVFNSYGAPEYQGAPIVTNLVAVSENEFMTLNGYLISTGMDANVSAAVFWGTNDAGRQAEGWTYTNRIPGIVAEGPLSADITPDKVGQLYYFRFSASNSFGQTWASPVHDFRWWADVRTGSVFSTW